MKWAEESVQLINFELSPEDLTTARKIISNYIKKIRQIVGCRELKIRLRKHKHGKVFLYELEAEAVIFSIKKTKRSKGRRDVLNASSTDYKLFPALSEVLGRVLSEAMHRSRTTKEIKGKIKQRKDKSFRI